MSDQINKNEEIIIRYLKTKTFGRPIDINISKYNEITNIKSRNDIILGDNISIYNTILNYKSFTYLFLKQVRTLSNITIDLVNNFEVNTFNKIFLRDNNYGSYISNIPYNTALEDPTLIDGFSFIHKEIFCVYGHKEKLCYVDRLRLIPINSLMEYYNISNKFIFNFPNPIISSSLNFLKIYDNEINVYLYENNNTNSIVIDKINISKLTKNNFIKFYNGVNNTNIDQKLLNNLLTKKYNVELKLYNNLYDIGSKNYSPVEISDFNKNYIERLYKYRLFKTKTDLQTKTTLYNNFKIKIYTNSIDAFNKQNSIEEIYLSQISNISEYSDYEHDFLFENLNDNIQLSHNGIFKTEKGWFNNGESYYDQQMNINIELDDNDMFYINHNNNKFYIQNTYNVLTHEYFNFNVNDMFYIEYNGKTGWISNEWSLPAPSYKQNCSAIFDKDKNITQPICVFWHPLLVNSVYPEVDTFVKSKTKIYGLMGDNVSYNYDWYIDNKRGYLIIYNISEKIHKILTNGLNKNIWGLDNGISQNSKIPPIHVSFFRYVVKNKNLIDKQPPIKQLNTLIMKPNIDVLKIKQESELIKTLKLNTYKTSIKQSSDVTNVFDNQKILNLHKKHEKDFNKKTDLEKFVFDLKNDKDIHIQKSNEYNHNIKIVFDKKDFFSELLRVDNIKNINIKHIFKKFNIKPIKNKKFYETQIFNTYLDKKTIYEIAKLKLDKHDKFIINNNNFLGLEIPKTINLQNISSYKDIYKIKNNIFYEQLKSSYDKNNNNLDINIHYPINITIRDNLQYKNIKSDDYKKNRKWVITNYDNKDVKNILFNIDLDKIILKNKYNQNRIIKSLKTKQNVNIDQNYILTLFDKHGKILQPKKDTISEDYIQIEKVFGKYVNQTNYLFLDDNKFNDIKNIKLPNITEKKEVLNKLNNLNIRTHNKRLNLNIRRIKSDKIDIKLKNLNYQTHIYTFSKSDIFGTNIQQRLQDIKLDDRVFNLKEILTKNINFLETNFRSKKLYEYLFNKVDIVNKNTKNIVKHSKKNYKNQFIKLYQNYSSFQDIDLINSVYDEEIKNTLDSIHISENYFTENLELDVKQKSLLDNNLLETRLYKKYFTPISRNLEYNNKFDNLKKISIKQKFKSSKYTNDLNIELDNIVFYKRLGKINKKEKDFKLYLTYKNQSYKAVKNLEYIRDLDFNRVPLFKKKNILTSIIDKYKNSKNSIFINKYKSYEGNLFKIGKEKITFNNNQFNDRYNIFDNLSSKIINNRQYDKIKKNIFIKNNKTHTFINIKKPSLIKDTIFNYNDTFIIKSLNAKDYNNKLKIFLINDNKTKNKFVSTKYSKSNHHISINIEQIINKQEYNFFNNINNFINNNSEFLYNNQQKYGINKQQTFSENIYKPLYDNLFYINRLKDIKFEKTFEKIGKFNTIYDNKRRKNLNIGNYAYPKLVYDNNDTYITNILVKNKSNDDNLFININDIIVKKNHNKIKNAILYENIFVEEPKYDNTKIDFENNIIGTFKKYLTKNFNNLKIDTYQNTNTFLKEQIYSHTNIKLNFNSNIKPSDILRYKNRFSFDTKNINSKRLLDDTINTKINKHELQELIVNPKENKLETFVKKEKYDDIDQYLLNLEEIDIYNLDDKFDIYSKRFYNKQKSNFTKKIHEQKINIQGITNFKSDNIKYNINYDSIYKSLGKQINDKFINILPITYKNDKIFINDSIKINLIKNFIGNNIKKLNDLKKDKKIFLNDNIVLENIFIKKINKKIQIKNSQFNELLKHLINIKEFSSYDLKKYININKKDNNFVRLFFKKVDKNNNYNKVKTENSYYNNNEHKLNVKIYDKDKSDIINIKTYKTDNDLLIDNIKNDYLAYNEENNITQIRAESYNYINGNNINDINVLNKSLKIHKADEIRSDTSIKYTNSIFNNTNKINYVFLRWLLHLFNYKAKTDNSYEQNYKRILKFDSSANLINNRLNFFPVPPSIDWANYANEKTYPILITDKVTINSTDYKIKEYNNYITLDKGDIIYIRSNDISDNNSLYTIYVNETDYDNGNFINENYGLHKNWYLHINKTGEILKNEINVNLPILIYIKSTSLDIKYNLSISNDLLDISNHIYIYPPFTIDNYGSYKTGIIGNEVKYISDLGTQVSKRDTVPFIDLRKYNNINIFFIDNIDFNTYFISLNLYNKLNGTELDNKIHIDDINSLNEFKKNYFISSAYNSLQKIVDISNIIAFENLSEISGCSIQIDEITKTATFSKGTSNTFVNYLNFSGSFGSNILDSNSLSTWKVQETSNGIDYIDISNIMIINYIITIDELDANLEKIASISFYNITHNNEYNIVKGNVNGVPSRIYEYVNVYYSSECIHKQLFNNFIEANNGGQDIRSRLEEYNVFINVYRLYISYDEYTDISNNIGRRTKNVFTNTRSNTSTIIRKSSENTYFDWSNFTNSKIYFRNQLTYDELVNYKTENDDFLVQYYDISNDVNIIDHISNIYNIINEPYFSFYNYKNLDDISYGIIWNDNVDESLKYNQLLVFYNKTRIRIGNISDNRIINPKAGETINILKSKLTENRINFIINSTLHEGLSPVTQLLEILSEQIKLDKILIETNKAGLSWDIFDTTGINIKYNVNTVITIWFNRFKEKNQRTITDKYINYKPYIDDIKIYNGNDVLIDINKFNPLDITSNSHITIENYNILTGYEQKISNPIKIKNIHIPYYGFIYNSNSYVYKLNYTGNIIDTKIDYKIENQSDNLYGEWLNIRETNKFFNIHTGSKFRLRLNDNNEFSFYGYFKNTLNYNIQNIIYYTDIPSAVITPYLSNNYKFEIIEKNEPYNVYYIQNHVFENIPKTVDYGLNSDGSYPKLNLTLPSNYIKLKKANDNFVNNIIDTKGSSLEILNSFNNQEDTVNDGGVQNLGMGINEINELRQRGLKFNYDKKLNLVKIINNKLDNEFGPESWDEFKRFWNVISVPQNDINSVILYFRNISGNLINNYKPHITNEPDISINIIDWNTYKPYYFKNYPIFKKLPNKDLINLNNNQIDISNNNGINYITLSIAGIDYDISLSYLSSGITKISNIKDIRYNNNNSQWKNDDDMLYLDTDISFTDINNNIINFKNNIDLTIKNIKLYTIDDFKKLFTAYHNWYLLPDYYFSGKIDILNNRTINKYNLKKSEYDPASDLTINSLYNWELEPMIIQPEYINSYEKNDSPNYIFIDILANYDYKIMTLKIKKNIDKSWIIRDTINRNDKIIYYNKYLVDNCDDNFSDYHIQKNNTDIIIKNIYNPNSRELKENNILGNTPVKYNFRKDMLFFVDSIGEVLSDKTLKMYNINKSFKQIFNNITEINKSKMKINKTYIFKNFADLSNNFYNRINLIKYYNGRFIKPYNFYNFDNVYLYRNKFDNYPYIYSNSPDLIINNFKNLIARNYKNGYPTLENNIRIFPKIKYNHYYVWEYNNINLEDLSANQIYTSAFYEWEQSENRWVNSNNKNIQTKLSLSEYFIINLIYNPFIINTNNFSPEPIFTDIFTDIKKYKVKKIDDQKKSIILQHKDLTQNQQDINIYCYNYDDAFNPTDVKSYWLNKDLSENLTIYESKKNSNSLLKDGPALTTATTSTGYKVYFIREESYGTELIIFNAKPIWIYYKNYNINHLSNNSLTNEKYFFINNGKIFNTVPTTNEIILLWNNILNNTHLYNLIFYKDDVGFIYHYNNGEFVSSQTLKKTYLDETSSIDPIFNEWFTYSDTQIRLTKGTSDINNDYVEIKWDIYTIMFLNIDYYNILNEKYNIDIYKRVHKDTLKSALNINYASLDINIKNKNIFTDIYCISGEKYFRFLYNQTLKNKDLYTYESNFNNHIFSNNTNYISIKIDEQSTPSKDYINPHFITDLSRNLLIPNVFFNNINAIFTFNINLNSSKNMKVINKFDNKIYNLKQKIGAQSDLGWTNHIIDSVKFTSGLTPNFELLLEIKEIQNYNLYFQLELSNIPPNYNNGDYIILTSNQTSKTKKAKILDICDNYVFLDIYTTNETNPSVDNFDSIFTNFKEDIDTKNVLFSHGKNYSVNDTIKFKNIDNFDYQPLSNISGDNFYNKYEINDFNDLTDNIEFNNLKITNSYNIKYTKIFDDIPTRIKVLIDEDKNSGTIISDEVRFSNTNQTFKHSDLRIRFIKRISKTKQSSLSSFPINDDYITGTGDITLVDINGDPSTTPINIDSYLKISMGEDSKKTFYIKNSITNIFDGFTDISLGTIINVYNENKLINAYNHFSISNTLEYFINTPINFDRDVFVINNYKSIDFFENINNINIISNNYNPLVTFDYNINNIDYDISNEINKNLYNLSYYSYDYYHDNNNNIQLNKNEKIKINKIENIAYFDNYAEVETEDINAIKSSDIITEFCDFNRVLINGNIYRNINKKYKRNLILEKEKLHLNNKYIITYTDKLKFENNGNDTTAFLDIKCNIPYQDKVYINVGDEVIYINNIYNSIIIKQHTYNDNYLWFDNNSFLVNENIEDENIENNESGRKTIIFDDIGVDIDNRLIINNNPVISTEKILEIINSAYIYYNQKSYLANLFESNFIKFNFENVNNIIGTNNSILVFIYKNYRCTPNQMVKAVRFVDDSYNQIDNITRGDIIKSSNFYKNWRYGYDCFSNQNELKTKIKNIMRIKIDNNDYYIKKNDNHTDFLNLIFNIGYYCPEKLPYEYNGLLIPINETLYPKLILNHIRDNVIITDKFKKTGLGDTNGNNIEYTGDEWNTVTPKIYINDFTIFNKKTLNLLKYDNNKGILIGIYDNISCYSNQFNKVIRYINNINFNNILHDVTITSDNIYKIDGINFCSNIDDVISVVDTIEPPIKVKYKDKDYYFLGNDPSNLFYHILFNLAYTD